MSELLVLLLVTLVVLIGLMVGATWAMNKASAKLIGEKHRDLELIVTTGEVPPSWVKPHRQRMARLAPGPNREVLLRQLEQRARGSYVRRLEELIGYAKTTPLVQDEETREVLLAELAAVRQAWLGTALTPCPLSHGDSGADTPGGVGPHPPTPSPNTGGRGEA